MTNHTSIMRSSSSAVQNRAAYRAILDRWPVPYDELSILTRFGATSVIACGPRDASPVFLLHSGDFQEPLWIRNIEVLSKAYRVYALDLIGELNKSVRIRPIRSHQRFMNWMTDLFEGLHIESADLVSSSQGWFFLMDTALYLPRKSSVQDEAKSPALTSRKDLPSLKIELASHAELI